MENDKNGRPLPRIVKETIDFAYEMLIQHQDGVVFSPSGLGFNEARVFAILYKRGIIERTCTARTKGPGHEYKYKWAANSAPTKVLYGSITDELRDIDRKKRERKKARKQRQPDVRDEVAPIIVDPPQKERIIALAGFSSQELWDELERRGCTIENNIPVIITITKEYLK